MQPRRPGAGTTISESLGTFLRVELRLRRRVPDVQHVVRCPAQVDVLRQQRQEGSLLFPAHRVRPVQLDLCLTKRVVLEGLWSHNTLHVCPSSSSATVTLSSSVCSFPESSRCFGSLKVINWCPQDTLKWSTPSSRKLATNMAPSWPV